MPQKRCPLAFGSTQKRFGRVTIHPRLNKDGISTVKPIGCNPSYYHPKDVRDIYPLKTKVPLKEPWTNQNEVEDWSLNLGYRNQTILNERRRYKTILGPVWYTIREPAAYSPACKNVTFGRTPRFKPLKVDVPGPITYYRDCPYKAPYGSHSERASFERGDPCRFKDPSPKWSLACNRYTIIDKDNIDEKSKKSVSLRGPYDLFTGNRDEKSIKNHFNTTNKVSAATWPYMLSGSFETYKTSRLGVMNKTNRSLPYRGRMPLSNLEFSLRNPKEPGPAAYNIDKEKVFKQNRYGFNSSNEKPRCYQRFFIWPGVGRYRTRNRPWGIPGKGHKHVFQSKVPRTIGCYLPELLNSF